MCVKRGEVIGRKEERHREMEGTKKKTTTTDVVFDSF
jgi:hypothetical protein